MKTRASYVPRSSFTFWNSTTQCGLLVASVVAIVVSGCGSSPPTNQSTASSGTSTGSAGGSGGVGGEINSGGGGQGGANANGGGGSGGHIVNMNCTPSEHYGYDGELWKPAGRLLDYAWAGYRTGTEKIPTIVEPTKSVTDFGAIADDDGDDTQAFLDAIAATPYGVLLVPAGKFIITQRLEITKPNFVFRGAGRDKTTLYFPKSLGDVYGLTFNSAGQSNWSFGGGFITVTGNVGGGELAQVTTNAARGDNTLEVSTTAGFSAGQWIRIIQTDVNGSLLKALHGGYYNGNTAEDGGKSVFKFLTPITAVGTNTITLARPLPLKVDTTWTPSVRTLAPTVSEVGIEDMRIEFVGTTYPGHFKEHGYNAIDMGGVTNSWVRNVAIINADYGITVHGSFFVTVTDVVLNTNFNRGSLVGHHGLNSAAGADVLITRFDVKKTFVHDLTVDNYAFATVFSNGQGVDLNMDHHGRGNYGTLWTNLDFGAGKRPFGSGGNASRMPHSGARTAYWNLFASANLALPATDFGPLLTFIAVQGSSGTTADSWVVEKIPGADLCQPNLHEAMLSHR